MSINITEPCKNFLAGCRVREERVIECINKPTKRHFVNVDDLTLEFYTLREKVGKYTLLIIGQRMETELRVLYAFKILDTLCENIVSMAPLNMLEALIERFGIKIDVAGKQALFFLNEQMELKEGTDLNKIISTVERSQSDDVIVASFFKVNTKKNLLECALSFALDRQRYEEWLKTNTRGF